MSTVVALASQKGGVGKTTTAINLGACLAGRDLRVLLVDTDPQANATTGLGLDARAGRSIYQVLVDDVSLREVIVDTAQPNLWLVPSSGDLAGAEVELVSLADREFRLLRKDCVLHEKLFAAQSRRHFHLQTYFRENLKKKTLRIAA